MSATTLAFPARDTLAEELACLATGTLVTLALFTALSHSQHREPVAPPAVPEDLRAFSVPLEPPPAPPSRAEYAVADAGAFVPINTGLEASPGDSPIHLAVSPLQFDLPPLPATVPVQMTIAQSYPKAAPGLDVGINEQQIYQQAEVDQLPRAVKQSLQFIPHALRVNLTQIRVVLVMLMEKNGKISSAHVVKSCGVKALDDIVVRSVREDWEFVPAIRRGKAVRCQVQQSFLIKLESGSPLEAH